MKEIKLRVEEKNLEIVMSILNNLKEGLIVNIEGFKSEKTTTQYNPRTKTVIKEEESGTSDTSGKYVSPLVYKQRLKKS